MCKQGGGKQGPDLGRASPRHCGPQCEQKAGARGKVGDQGQRRDANAGPHPIEHQNGPLGQHQGQYPVDQAAVCE